MESRIDARSFTGVHRRAQSSSGNHVITQLLEICFLNIISAVIVDETRNLFVERDHGPPAEGAARFHTTRWTIVMRAALSQVQWRQSALAGWCRLYYYPLYIFARRHGHSPAEIFGHQPGRLQSSAAAVSLGRPYFCRALLWFHCAMERLLAQVKVLHC
jgi:hypothetical protein